MSDLIREYRDFIEELRENYAARGFRILSPDQVSQELTFQPDLVVSRGNEVVVIEVKSSARESKRQITEMRRKAAELGYGFELKVLPRTPRKTVRSDEKTKVPRLIAEARDFFDQGKLDLALLLSWIAIEIAIRAMSGRASKNHEPVTASGDVIRLATELEVIAEEDLPNVRAIAELRDRLVHGFQTDVPPDLVRLAMALANNIARRADLLDDSPRS